MYKVLYIPDGEFLRGFRFKPLNESLIDPEYQYNTYGKDTIRNPAYFTLRSDAKEAIHLLISSRFPVKYLIEEFDIVRI